MPRDRATRTCDARRSRSLTRRTFVRTGASFATGTFAGFAVLPSLSCGGRDETTLEQELAGRMLEIFDDRDALASLGRAYLAITPEEATVRALVSGLTEGWTVAQRALPSPELLALLREQQRADFSSGRTLRVRGWVLARTEARLAALSVSARGV